jgi:hypothetical protein
LAPITFLFFLPAGKVADNHNFLLKKEMIFKEYDSNGAPYYQSYDVFFERWIHGKDF